MGARNGKLNSRSRQANVLFLGLRGSGKTSILNKLSKGNIPQICPTSGFSIVKLNLLGFKLCCYDIGDESTWPEFYKKANVVVYVIDSTDRKRIEKAGSTLQILLDDPRLVGVPLLILSNKQDIFDAASATEISDGLNCSQIRGRLWQIKQTSAKTGEGLNTSFEWIARTLAEKTLSGKEMKKMKFALKS